MSFLKRKEIPLILFSVSGLFIWFSYFTGIGTEQASMLMSWPVTLAAFSIILGISGFVRSNIIKISKQAKGWPYSLLALSSFIITLASGFISPPLYDYIVTNIVILLQVALLSFTGFYNYTLFFRATRARSIWVGILITITIIFLLWNVPLGQLYLGQSFTSAAKWVYDFPNKGGMKGLMIVIAVGMVGLFIRGCLGYEKSYVGGD